MHSKQEQNETNTQLLEQVFQCLTHLFKYLWCITLKDLASLYELYSKFLFSSSTTNTSTTNYEYLRSFAAESFAYLLRKIENYQPFIDYLFDWRERDENELESLALVFSETCQNVQSTFHSCTKSLLLCLLKKLIVKPTLMQSCVRTIYSLLIEHTNQQNVAIRWSCLLEGYRAVDNEEKNHVVYRSFYELSQLLIDHRMIIDVKLCWEFLIQVRENDDEDFSTIHYETVATLFEQMAVDQQLIEIYYRFADQTSPELLYQQTRKLFHSHLTKKLPNEFYHHLWKHVISKTIDPQQLIDYFVDFLLIGRKQNELILIPWDNDQTIREKIEETNTLVQGQLWRALLLANSSIVQTHADKVALQLQTHPVSSSTVAITLLELISRGHSFPTSFWYAQLERAPQSEVYLLCTRVAFLLNPPSVDSFDQFIELLKRNLSSFKSTIRLLTLRILASFPTEPNHVITNCLTCEECPWSSCSTVSPSHPSIYRCTTSSDYCVRIAHRCDCGLSAEICLVPKGRKHWNMWDMLSFDQFSMRNSIGFSNAMHFRPTKKRSTGRRVSAMQRRTRVRDQRRNHRLHSIPVESLSNSQSFSSGMRTEDPCSSADHLRLLLRRVLRSSAILGSVWSTLFVVHHRISQQDHQAIIAEILRENIGEYSEPLEAIQSLATVVGTSTSVSVRRAFVALLGHSRTTISLSLPLELHSVGSVDDSVGVSLPFGEDHAVVSLEYLSQDVSWIGLRCVARFERLRTVEEPIRLYSHSSSLQQIEREMKLGFDHSRTQRLLGVESEASLPVSRHYRLERTLPTAFSLLPPVNLGSVRRASRTTMVEYLSSEGLHSCRRRSFDLVRDLHQVSATFVILVKTFVTKLGVYIQQQIDDIFEFYISTIKLINSLSHQKSTDRSYWREENAHFAQTTSICSITVKSMCSRTRRISSMICGCAVCERVISPNIDHAKILFMYWN